MHSFNLKNEQKFDPKKHVEQVLGRVAEGDVTVACWEPGQTSPYHCHPQATEIYFCFEGGGTMRTPQETVTVTPGSFVVHPPGELHEWTTGPDRTLLFRVRYGGPHQGMAEQSRLAPAPGGCRILQGGLISCPVQMPAITIDESRIGHIFREAPGHFRRDRLVNRQSLIEVASRPGNFVGTDRFGVDWFAEIRPDGTQVWVHVRARKITNGGVNLTPRRFDVDRIP